MSASAELRSLASAMNHGQTLTSRQAATRAAYEKKFGRATGSGIRGVAGQLDRIASAIGVEGQGGKVEFGVSDGKAAANAAIGGNTMTIRPRFFGEDGGLVTLSQGGVILHEGGHMAGLDDVALPIGAPPGIGRKWPDGSSRAYGQSATDWLGANAPRAARNNSDSYACLTELPCGGP